MPTAFAAMRAFVHACLGGPINQEDLETLIAFNVMVLRFTSLTLTLRKAIDFTPLIAALDNPILATYGMRDTAALPVAGGHIVSVCRRATRSFYEDAGHAPLMEYPERFNRALAAFARQTQTERRVCGKGSYFRRRLHLRRVLKVSRNSPPVPVPDRVAGMVAATGLPSADRSKPR
jgi:hypothetical protein